MRNEEHQPFPRGFAAAAALVLLSICHFHWSLGENQPRQFSPGHAGTSGLQGHGWGSSPTPTCACAHRTAGKRLKRVWEADGMCWNHQAQGMARQALELPLLFPFPSIFPHWFLPPWFIPFPTHPTSPEGPSQHAAMSSMC